MYLKHYKNILVRKFASLGHMPPPHPPHPTKNCITKIYNVHTTIFLLVLEHVHRFLFEQYEICLPCSFMSRVALCHVFVQ
jgi:hypothetical protein